MTTTVATPPSITTVRVEVSQDLTIEVTLGDILSGDRTNPYSCALARAAHRQLGLDLRFVHVDPIIEVVSIWTERAVHEYAIPLAIAAAIRRWDDGGTLDPFTVTLTHCLDV